MCARVAAATRVRIDGTGLPQTRPSTETNMGTNIHPTAIVDPRAELGNDVTVGPYTVIGAGVTIGDGTSLGPYVVVEGHTEIGKNNIVYAGAVLGSRSQDLKDHGEDSYLRIGDANIFREYVTVNCGLAAETARTTVIGDNNLFMALTHVAHDCQVGNHVVMANLSGLGGHVVAEDRCIIGGMAAVHQHVMIGTMALIGGLAKVVKDVLPYMIVDGNPATCRGPNIVGLTRNQVSETSRRALKKAYRLLSQSSLNTSQALEEIEKEVDNCPEITHLIDFIGKSKRGVCK